MNKLTDILQCDRPVICGAMGMLSGPGLVSAVSEAGGFGVLATAFATDPDLVRDMIRQTRKRTKKPFGLNLQVMNPLCEQFLTIAAEEGVAAVTVSGGNPARLMENRPPIPFLVVTGTVRAAKKAAALGADAVIVEGAESGGIQGMKTAATMALAPAVADAVDTPIVAAGGIADHRGFLAAMELGACGVQMGTRFIATEECPAHESYKQAILTAGPEDTLLLCAGSFAVRTLPTPLTQAVQQGQDVDLDKLAGPALENAWLHGADPGVLPAGQGCGIINEILPAAEVVRLVAGA
ncbi:MAG: nitronate monooxygenase [Deltaproteobacteria bacterium]|nr:nitronate monooxygenase [Deltaproteobacteria bacterium]